MNSSRWKHGIPKMEFLQDGNKRAYCYGTSGSLLGQLSQMLSDVPESALRCVRQISVELFQTYIHQFRNTKQKRRKKSALMPFISLRKTASCKWFLSFPSFSLHLV